MVDAAGTIVKEMRAESAPDALNDALKRLALPLVRVGMEACSLTAWRHDGLAEAGWPAICIETLSPYGRGQLETPRSPDRIMRRSGIDRAEQRVTGRSEPSRKWENETEQLDTNDLNQRRLFTEN